VKPIDELTEQDVPGLVLRQEWDVIAELINIKIQEPTSLADCILANIYDTPLEVTETDLVELLYNKLKQGTISTLSYNYLVQASCHKRPALLS